MVALLFFLLWMAQVATAGADLEVIDTGSDAAVQRFAAQVSVSESNEALLAQWDFDAGERDCDLRGDWIQFAGSDELLLMKLATLDPDDHLEGWWIESGEVRRAKLDPESLEQFLLDVEALDSKTIVGIHWEASLGGLPGYRVLPLSGSVATREARIRLRDGANVDLELVPKSVSPEAIEHRVLVESTGVATDEIVRLTLGEDACRGRLAPFSMHSRPRCVMRVRAVRTRDFTGQLEWLNVARWDMAAYNIGPLVEQARDQATTMGEKAREIAPGLPTTRHFEVPLYEWLRENITEVPGEGWGSQRTRTPEQVVLEGVGSEFERALALAAMLEGTGSKVEVVLVGGGSEGRLEMDVPSGYQLGHTLLRVGGERWYDPGCSTCPAGAIRPRFLGRRGMLIASDHRARIDAAQKSLSWQFSFDGRTSDRRGSQYYFDRLLEEADLFEWIDLPDLDRGLLREEVLVAPEGEGMVLTWSGRRGSWVDVNWNAIPTDDLDPASVLMARQPSSTGFDILGVHETADSLRVSAWVDGPVPPSAVGEWSLPGRWLHGNEFLAPWEPNAECPLSIDEPLELHRTVRLPVPPGWGHVVFPRDESDEVGVLSWSRTSRREGEDIVIDVRLRLSPVHLDRVDLQLALVASLERYRALVEKPFVIGRGA